MRAYGRRVSVFTGGHSLEGLVAVPEGAVGLAVVANPSAMQLTLERALTRALLAARVGVLPIELWPSRELLALLGRPVELEETARRFDAALAWVRSQEELASWPVGVFGLGQDGVAALLSAAGAREPAAAVVCAGGREAFAASFLKRVRVPVLLVAGGEDPQALADSGAAREHLGGPSELRVVPGADPWFQTRDAPWQLAALTSEWLHAQLEQRVRSLDGFREPQRWV